MSREELLERSAPPRHRMNLDFAALDLEGGFSPREGGVAGVSEKVHWEELYLLEGDMTVGDPHGGERVIRAPAYACREPGFMHGPVRTEGGCLLLEFSSYSAAASNA